MRVSISFLIPFALVAVGIAVRALDPPPLQNLRGATFDLYQRLAPRPYLPQRVRVIDIGNESLKRIGQWPWPRVVIAEMIEKLRNAGATAIALDIVFAEPDRTSPSRILSIWPKSKETDTLRNAVAAGRLPDHDDILARTIGGGKVVTGFALKAEAGGAPLSKASIATMGADPLGAVPRLGGALPSLAKFQAAAAGNGALTMIPDPDGVLRRIPLLLGIGDAVYPSLAAEALRVAQGAKTYVARAASQGTLANLVIGAHTVPTSIAGDMRLYDTGPKPRRILPAWRVLKGGLKPNEFANAIVFVGSSATGIDDVQTSPLDTRTLGVSIHAQAVEQILSRNFISRPFWAGALEIIVATLICGLLILILHRVSALVGFALTEISIVSVVALCWVAFSEGGLLLDPGFGVTIVAAVHLSSTVIAYQVSEKKRRMVRTAFGQYLAPALVEQLAANPDRLALGGDTREVTILFCDIRGFTAIAEKLEAQAVTQLVNRFMTAMTGAILDHGGTVDKYIGDCVMAFWNAPLDDAAHAQHACDAALSMRARLRQLNEELSAEADDSSPFFVPIKMGIGINTGTCCVGNMGSEQRFNYSALGDSVNLAARLEEETKNCGVDIVVGETTRQRVPNIPSRELGKVTVRGRSQSVSIFTLLDEPSAKSDRKND